MTLLRAAFTAIVVLGPFGASHAVESEPPKSETKKQVPGKPAPAPKKPVKNAPKAAPAKPSMKIYPAASVPALRDKDGNVIPTNAEAYDVSSALPKKK